MTYGTRSPEKKVLGTDFVQSLPDGTYRVEVPGLCAGFVMRGGKVIQCAPILARRLDYWAHLAQRIEP